MRRGFFGHRRGRHFRRFIARKLLMRLDTTPGQEKAIRTAVETVRNSLHSGREELQSVRRDLAQAFGAEALDEQALQAAISKQEAFVNRSRTEVVQAIRNVHEALDPRQRRQVSEWISSGFMSRDHRERDRDDDWI
jgi:Spy/CpxP family protein refolding chaperone